MTQNKQGQPAPTHLFTVRQGRVEGEPVWLGPMAQGSVFPSSLSSARRRAVVSLFLSPIRANVPLFHRAHNRERAASSRPNHGAAGLQPAEAGRASSLQGKHRAGSSPAVSG